MLVASSPLGMQASYVYIAYRNKGRRVVEHVTFLHYSRVDTIRSGASATGARRDALIQEKMRKVKCEMSVRDFNIFDRTIGLKLSREICG